MCTVQPDYFFANFQALLLGHACCKQAPRSCLYALRYILHLHPNFVKTAFFFHNFIMHFNPDSFITIHHSFGACCSSLFIRTFMCMPINGSSSFGLESTRVEQGCYIVPTSVLLSIVRLHLFPASNVLIYSLNQKRELISADVAMTYEMSSPFYTSVKPTVHFHLHSQLTNGNLGLETAQNICLISIESDIPTVYPTSIHLFITYGFTLVDEAIYSYIVLDVVATVNTIIAYHSSYMYIRKSSN